MFRNGIHAAFLPLDQDETVTAVKIMRGRGILEPAGG
jgi:hypothetical protein